MKRALKDSDKPKLCFVVSAPMTAVAFLNGHIDYLSGEYEVTVVCNFDGTEKDISKNASLKNIRIARNISPISDLKAVYSLARFLKKGDFQITHSVTPKAGLTTALAGWLTRIPIRIHWFTGQVWVLRSGPFRALLKNIDRLIARLNTSLLVDSLSQRDFLIAEQVVNPLKARVLGAGSISGVDTERFRPNAELRRKTRDELQITDPSATIILFVGRFNHDKGIETVLKAFRRQTLKSNTYLLLVGVDEGNYLPRIPDLLGAAIEKFRYISFTSEPEKYMAAADIFLYPSLREGFGLSVIEAGASGLPAVASRIYGITDAIIDGETGFLTKAGDVEEVCDRLELLTGNQQLHENMGENARLNVLKLWQSSQLERALLEYYQVLRLPPVGTPRKSKGKIK